MKRLIVFKVVTILASIILGSCPVAWRFPISSSFDLFSEISEQRQQETKQEETQGARLTSEEVKVLIETLFSGVFRDDDRIAPTHLIGDFNGDGIKDIAIAVQLSKDIDKNDPSKPPFNLYRPIHTGLKPEDYNVKDKIGVLAHYSNRTHLIILHGTRERGWGNSLSQERYVLLDFPGIAPNKIKIYRGKLRSATAGDEPKPTPPPRLVADAILADEVFEEGMGAIIYWDGKRYREYPFNTSRK